MNVLFYEILYLLLFVYLLQEEASEMKPDLSKDYDFVASFRIAVSLRSSCQSLIGLSSCALNYYITFFSVYAFP